MEVRCPECEAQLIEPYRGNGRLTDRVDVRRHRTKPDTILARCPDCGKTWEVPNARIVIFPARAPAPSGGVLP